MVNLVVEHRDDYWEKKNYWAEHGKPLEKEYVPIHMPKNTPAGFLIGIFAGVFGFAAIWHMLIPAIASLIAIFAVAIYRTCETDVDYYISAEEVKHTEIQKKKEALA